MTTATPIRIAHDTIDRPALFLALELSANQWKLGFTTGTAQRPRERNVPARHIEAVREEIRKGVSPQAAIRAGQRRWLAKYRVRHRVARNRYAKS